MCDYQIIGLKILEKIRQYQRVIIARHTRPDGDAVGSSLGLRRILRDAYPEKEVFVINGDRSDYLTFLGEEDAPVNEELYVDALMIVLDTGDAKRISNPCVSLCREVVRLDHHVDHSPYCETALIDEEASSTCEVVARLCALFPEEWKLSREAAECLYTGMVTDTGRFRYACTPETLRTAAVLLETGVDTERIFSRLYIGDFEDIRIRGEASKRIRRTEHGVVYVYLTAGTQKKLGMTREKASEVITLMESVRGSLIWMAFIENGDGTTRVRLRSRFLTVRELAEKYRGGGHDKAAGATVYNRKEARELLAEADELLRDYLEKHPDLL